jgi:hypothetical protein
MSEANLILFLKELEQAVGGVQNQLIARNTGGIWEALAVQEATVDKITRLSSEQGDDFRGLSRRNPVVRNLLERSRATIQANRALSKTFLQVIDQTLANLSGSPFAAYSGRGTNPQRSSPLLVNQQG